MAKLAALADARATGDAQVTGVTHASTGVRPGDLYAALPGARRHGSEFIPGAKAAGAVAVLTDPAGAAAAAAAGLPALIVPDPRAVLGTVASAIYGDPTGTPTDVRDGDPTGTPTDVRGGDPTGIAATAENEAEDEDKGLIVIGITGTAGKTSTAYLIESGLRAAGHVTGLIGTVETRLGDLAVDSVRTTPEATDLHALLAAARERGVTAVVMEVSSHALVMGRVGGVRFAVGGYTNFGLDHLDFHADADDYFAAKAKLFDGRCRVEILNHDDPALAPLRKPATVTYSAVGDPQATWWSTDVRGTAYAQLFMAHGPDGAVAAGVALPGRHNVANALLAIAALAAVGIDPATAARGVAACPGVPGRLERVDAPGPVLGVVDYAHKPDAIVAALTALRDLAAARGGQVICVIGAGGDRDRSKRPLMGAAAAHGADLVVVTDDNPRTEDPAAIRREVLAGTAGASAKVIEVAGRRAAIDEAVRLAAPGDVVAVLGKGHERGQDVGGAVLPFDDRVELAAALSEGNA
ncbi:UDP-N-acetylmuramoyl-L-alanyl-D-glutamate--2,6-diaminopimelate ligase [Actinomycetes bacterium KLBMP 9797]